MRACLLLLIITCFFAVEAKSQDFRSPEEPGFRLTSKTHGSQGAPERALLNCVMPGFLDLAYVEACAIFKHGDERVLECRYDKEALERHPLAERSKEEEQILITCSDQSLSKTK